MERNPSTTPEPTEPQKTFADVLAGWLRVWSRLYRRELTEEDFTIYGELLKDLTPEQLDTACRAASQKCTFFPSPAEIRAQIEKANAGGLQLEAKEAWATYRKHVDENYHPDLGWRRGTPSLSAAVEHAGRQAGGANWVSTCPESELQWCEKRFVEDFVLVHETGQVENLLTHGEARRILGELAARATEQNARLLAPPAEAPAQSRSEPERDPTAVAGFLEAARKVAGIPTEEEFERRKREQLARLDAHLREHPELSAAETPATVAG